MQSNSVPVVRGSVIALDLETTGLSYVKGHKPFCMAYYTEKGEYGFMPWDRVSKRFLGRLLRKRKKLVFHNAKFDLGFLHSEGLDIFDCVADIHCTLILSKLYNENGRHDLRSLAMRFLNASPGDKDEVEHWLKTNARSFKSANGRAPNFSDAPRDVVKRRCLWDVKHTLMLFGLLYPRVSSTCPELMSTEQMLMKVCVDMESYGVPVDLTRAAELKAEAEAGIEVLQHELESMVGSIEVERKRKGVTVTETVKKFKPNSQPQCVAAWRKLGIPLKFKTEPKRAKGGKMSGGGNWAFDEYAIIRYVSAPLAYTLRESSEEGWPWRKFYNAVHETVKKHRLEPREVVPPFIWKIRQLKKMVSTYYDYFLNNAVDVRIEPNGRRVGILHCKFNQSEALTGRFSSSEPNLQNQPRKLGPRECFITRRGRWNFHIDYDQVEMKFFTHFSEDAEMAKAVASDIHLHTAAKVYKLDPSKITSEQRKRAKGVNFGILYGAGAKTVAVTLTKKGLPTTALESSRICTAYHRSFPSVRALTGTLANSLKVNGYVENPFGRRYHIPVKFCYKALNYMCQGTSADLMKLSMVRAWKWLRAMKLKTRMILTVHDEIVFEVPATERWVIPELVKLMEDLKNFNVPITVSPEVVKRRWSKKEKYNMAG